MELVGVVGAGTMGGGIAQVLVKSGYSVILNDVAQQLLDRATERIAKGLARDVEKGRMTAQEREQALARLKTTTDLAAVAGADFIIEAVIENFEAKAGVFRALEAHARPEVIFASNTSSISISKLAAETKRPTQFIGLHFFNPVPVMKLVEVVPG
ncbi:MAG: 3-hydroxyacyl-CoA dehydrogenase NAD-binding domain-containing protein, partial [Terriglobia bacterium]